MSGKLIRINSRKGYSQLLKHFDNYHLLQSALWYKIKQLNHEPVLAFAWFREGSGNKIETPLFITKLIQIKALKKIVIFAAPFGPVVDFSQKPTDEDLAEFAYALSDELAEYHPAAIHFNPFSLDVKDNRTLEALLRSCKELVPGRPLAYQPGDGTITFDTSGPPEQGLLPHFREDTRYNIKRAEREHALDISTTDQPEALSSFWTLYKKAQERIGFVSDRKDIYENALKDKAALLFLAKDKRSGTLLSGILAILFKEQSTLITLVSATGPEGNKLRAPSLLRWRLFEWAHQNGFKRVDFFSLRRETKGYTFFKLGFGDNPLWYNTPYVYVVNKPLYRLYALYEKVHHKNN